MEFGIITYVSEIIALQSTSEIQIFTMKKPSNLNVFHFVYLILELLCMFINSKEIFLLETSLHLGGTWKKVYQNYKILSSQA
jgi:hypothetical protein